MHSSSAYAINKNLIHTSSTRLTNVINSNEYISSDFIYSIKRNSKNRLHSITSLYRYVTEVNFTIDFLGDSSFLTAKKSILLHSIRERALSHFNVKWYALFKNAFHFS